LSVSYPQMSDVARSYWRKNITTNRKRRNSTQFGKLLKGRISGFVTILTTWRNFIEGKRYLPIGRAQNLNTPVPHVPLYPRVVVVVFVFVFFLARFDLMQLFSRVWRFGLCALGFASSMQSLVSSLRLYANPFCQRSSAFLLSSIGSRRRHTWGGASGGETKPPVTQGGTSISGGETLCVEWLARLCVCGCVLERVVDSTMAALLERMPERSG
jgi:hypothetical protein